MSATKVVCTHQPPYSGNFRVEDKAKGETTMLNSGARWRCSHGNTWVYRPSFHDYSSNPGWKSEPRLLSWLRKDKNLVEGSYGLDS